MPVRLIKTSELGELLRMRRELWPDCGDEMHTFEMQQQSSQAETRAVLVFEREDGGLGGFAELSVRDRVDGSLSERVGYVEGWYVDSDLRGQGVGRHLIEAAEQWATARGLTELASDTEIENEQSIRAHTAVGFKETFRLVHFLKPLRKGHAPEN